MFDYNAGGRTRTDSLRTTLATLPAEITRGECGAKVVPDILKIKGKVHKFFSILFITWFFVSRLYLESDYGQRTDREEGLDTDVERAERNQAKK